ncbi:MAG: response regulator, partial [Pseudomonadota bacterium]
MADADGPQGPLEALRNAARGGQERFLVALAERDERERVATALTSEGFVLESTSLSDALGRLADESFDLAILDLPAAGQTPTPSTRPDAPVDARGSRDPLAASRELRPFSDIVLIGDGDPVRVGQAF